MVGILRSPKTPEVEAFSDLKSNPDQRDSGARHSPTSWPAAMCHRRPGRSLIGQAWVASTAAGRGPRSLALVGGPIKDQPLPTVVRCRERRQDVAPV